ISASSRRRSMSDLNPLLKAYYLIRYLGPRVITLRAGVYLDQWRGVTAKLYAPRPWETIQLADLVTPGVPTDIDGYARFKREQNRPFLFPLGRPPEIPDAIRQTPTDRSPTLRERLDALSEMRPIYF